MTSPLFVVVIDDNPSVCRALRRLLQAAEMEVETYQSGESFTHATLDREPDCLVLDIRMPGMSGPALRDWLNARGRHLPIVFITAHAEYEGDAAGSQAKILRKPFEGQALLDAINQVIGRCNP